MRVGIALAVNLCAASVCFARTTGTLFGHVTDEQGKPLPGAAVVVTSAVLQGTRTDTTAPDGGYRFSLLPPGRYRLELSLPGFEPIVNDGVVVELEEQTRIDARLRIARVEEALTVRADAIVIDPTQTNTQQLFHEDQLKYTSVGSRARTYFSILAQAPGVVEDYFTYSNPRGIVGDGTESSFLFDGLNTTDPVSHGLGVVFGFDAIQEISFQTAGFAAEYGRASGGVVNVVTKSGGNEFHGSLDARYGADGLTEQGSETRDYPPGTDELRYDKNSQVFRQFNPEATVGGPILRDRLWFFADAQHVYTKRQSPGIYGFEPRPRTFEGWNLFGKLSATPVANQTATFRYTNSYADVQNPDDPSVRPEAGIDTYQSVQIYNLEYDAVFSKNLLASLQAGTFGSYGIDAPLQGLEVPAVYDVVNGIQSDNATALEKARKERNQVLGSLTGFLEAAGSHSLKAGFYLESTKGTTSHLTTGTPPDPTWCSPEFGQPAGYPCGAFQLTADGDPFGWVVETRLPALTFKGTGMAFYLQDQWLPAANLTINAGIRYDQSRLSQEDGTHLGTYARFQPRLGIAWDVARDGSTIARVQFGEFQKDPSLDLVQSLAKNAPVDSLFLFNPDTGSYDFVQAFGTSPILIDPTYRYLYTREATVGVTRRVFANSSLDLSGVWRKTYNLGTFSCIDGTCQSAGQWLTNRPLGRDLLKQRYEGLILKFESRPNDRLRVLASYTLARLTGSVEGGGTGGSDDFVVFPDNYVNRTGVLSDDRRHELKIDGYVQLPLGFTAGSHFSWYSGSAYTITTTDSTGNGTVFLEPRGSRRNPSLVEWDIQLQKDFKLGPVSASIIASAINVLDTETALSFDGEVGEGGTVTNPTNPHFGYANGWQRPRRYELGVRVEF